MSPRGRPGDLKSPTRVTPRRRGDSSGRPDPVPDRRRRPSDGVLVEASIVARLLGIRLLRLDATVVLVPADVTAPSSAPDDSPGHTAGPAVLRRSTGAVRRRRAQLGRRSPAHQRGSRTPRRGAAQQPLIQRQAPLPGRPDQAALQALSDVSPPHARGVLVLGHAPDAASHAGHGLGLAGRRGGPGAASARAAGVERGSRTGTFVQGQGVGRDRR
jgi:hypothetical protein